MSKKRAQSIQSQGCGVVRAYSPQLNYAIFPSRCQVSVRPLKELVEELHLGEGRTNQNFIVARLRQGNVSSMADMANDAGAIKQNDINETFLVHFCGNSKSLKARVLTESSEIGAHSADSCR